jgi:DNA-binding NtrC family response regulator
MLVLKQGARI